MKWLIVAWALECAWIPQDLLVIHGLGQGSAYHLGALSQTLELEATAFDTLHVWTSLETYDYAVSAVAYAPFQANYYIGADVKLGPVTVGYEHLCRHPVWSYGQETYTLSGGYDKVYIRIEGETSW